MEKRVVFFLVISLLIIFGWNYFLDQMGWLPEPPISQEVVEEDDSSSRGKADPIASSSSTPSTESPTDSQSVSGNPGTPEIPASSKDNRANAILPSSSSTMVESIQVETDLYRAEFSNQGGVITSWELKAYTNPSPEGPVPIQLVYQEGQFKKPLSVIAADEVVTKQLSNGIYEVKKDFTNLSESRPTGRLTFSYADQESGIRVEKILTFHFDSYVVDISLKTSGISKQFDVSLGTNFGIVEWGEGFIGLPGPAFFIGEEPEKESPEQEVVKSGNVRWVALQDKYFISVFLPKDSESIVLTKEGENLVTAKSRFSGSSDASLQLFAGPKQYDHLTSLNVGLENTIDFGWFIYQDWSIFRIMSEPLFTILRFFYGFTQNYGFSIICVTVLIKLLFVPLQYKSYKSMKDMQVIQPKVLELQKRLKDDKERLNRELIKLYRDHKVNPVGGCLPMVLQMPVFIALFNILYMTIDLRQAPFILWIQDLSIPDPYFLLPILMGASMVVQQKIMPTTMDPTQAKMMLILPVFLTFIFLNFASGLVLYWLTNNILTITQQFVTDRYIFKRPTFTSGSTSSDNAGKSDTSSSKKGGGKDQDQKKK